ncbi:MAG: DNA alkylation repair protein [Lachnospiraceae bacterium]|nr:DNA alkylation repair protein [Lachnospiraceae bacterium]MBR2532043.1 DNA alkylation repair protein [Lachnospiraceae bacterium]
MSKAGSAPILDEIRERLFAEQDIPYREFQAKLIPGIDPESMIGVRTPALRRLAKEFVKREDIGTFLEMLPHRYFDENQLHAFIISEMKDYERCIALTEAFLPYIDNWATSDQLSPKIFKKHRPELLARIRAWLRSEETYVLRFAIGMLMQHFLDEDFDPAYPELVAGIRSDEYYVNMMIAWYFATALAKQYDAALPYIAEHRLAPRTHNKAIQKAIESYRITPGQKDVLRAMKIMGK